MTEPLITLLATTSPHASLTALQQGPHFADALIRMLVVLGVIVVVLVGLAVVVRRIRGTGRRQGCQQTLRVVETLDLDVRHRLHVVATADETLLLGVGGDQVVLLARRERSPEPVRDAVAAPSEQTSLRVGALAFLQRRHHRPEAS